MGSRAGFGVVLNRKSRRIFDAKPGDRLVVEVHVGDFSIRGQGFRVNRVTVILGSDRDLARDFVQDGLISAAVAELKLVSLCAESEG